jgi:hypothetical protein
MHDVSLIITQIVNITTLSWRLVPHASSMFVPLKNNKFLSARIDFSVRCLCTQVCFINFPL